MISIEFIRKNSELVKEKLALKKDSLSIDKLLNHDKDYRSLVTKVNDLRSIRNTVSKKIAFLKKDNRLVESEIAQMKEVGKSISIIEKEISSIKELIEFGYKGFLIGENFMKSDHPGNTARDFIKKIT